jgi:hypothetical protein
MTLRSIRTRLARLERRQYALVAGGVSPRFWDALCGAVPVEQLDQETRRLVAGLYSRSDDPDPVGKRIAEGSMS